MDRTIATMAEDIGLFDIVRKTATNVDFVLVQSYWNGNYQIFEFDDDLMICIAIAEGDS